MCSHTHTSPPPQHTHTYSANESVPAVTVVVSGHSVTLASEWPSTKRDDTAAHIMQDHSGIRVVTA